MSDEIKDWKWMVSLLVASALGLWAVKGMIEQPEAWWPILVFVGSGVFGIHGLLTFWDKRRQMQADLLASEQSALNATWESTMMHAMRDLFMVSPDLAFEMGRILGRPDLIVEPSVDGSTPAIYIAETKVRLDFMLYCLEQSTEDYFVAEGRFMDGTYRFDPNKKMTDREQWRQAVAWLWRKHRISQFVPGRSVNKSPRFLPPSNPETVRRWLTEGLTNERFEEASNVPVSEEAEA